MKKTKRISLVVSPKEHEALEQLAVFEGGLSKSALIRRLLRLSANKRGLWGNSRPDVN